MSGMKSQELIDRKRAQRRLHFALIANIILFFLNEVLSINLGIFYFRPEKIGVFLGVLVCFRYIPVAFFARGVGWLLHAFLVYNLILAFSAFYSPVLSSILNKANVLLFNVGQALLAYGIAGAIMRSGSLEALRKLIPWYVVLGIVNILAGYMDYIVGRRVIPSGVRSADYTYGIGIMGFHADRIYLGEYIVIAIACLIGLSSGSLKHRALLIAVTLLGGAQLVLMNSYTGMLGFTAIFVVYFIFAPLVKKIALIPLSGLVLLFIGFVYVTYAPEDIKAEQAMKFENRVAGEETTEWRYVASLLIWERVSQTPSFLGKGYRATEKLLEYYSGIVSTPHTVISIIYEQGLVGAAIFLWFICLYLMHFFGFMRRGGVPIAVKYLIVGLSIITLLRFSFYYQIRNEQSYIFTVAFLAAAWYLRATSARVNVGASGGLGVQ